MSYSEKLRDPRWQKMRLKIFERDGWKCQRHGCKSQQNATLAVHHKEYRPGKDPWEYPLDCLITFCEDCHETEHNVSERNVLIEGEFYKWRNLEGLLGFEPRGFLTQKDNKTLCGCFRLDYNPDAPNIVLPGTPEFIAEQGRLFAQQREFVPVLIKAPDTDWEYCGRYRVEGSTCNPVEIQIHCARAGGREGGISRILFLEKE